MKSITIKNDVVLIPEATKKGYAEAMIGDSVDVQYLNSNTRRGRVIRNMAHTIQPNGGGK